MFFKIDDKSVFKSVDFLEEFGTLYDLLIYLLSNSKRLLISAETQVNFGKAIAVLKMIILNMKTDITDQSEEQKKKIFAERESVLNNSNALLEKRQEIINQFTKNNIISRGEKFFDAPKRNEESISKELKQQFDQSIPKWVQVAEDRFNFVKLKINMNKNKSTTIGNKRYTPNDANNLVNKIAEKKIGKNNFIKEYNSLVDKAVQISKLRSTESRDKMLEIFNYLGEIFNKPTGEESALRGKGLKILTPNQMLSRLPISLAQLKAGNNSEKLRNEIRQLLYVLYRSKKLVYKRCL